MARYKKMAPSRDLGGCNRSIERGAKKGAEKVKKALNKYTYV